MANLASSLFEHGKINTTLAKAKALRPFAEKLITMAVKAHRAVDAAVKLHYRRLVIARLRSEGAARELFDVKAVEFVNRQGGYTRIYKLIPRIGDGAKMAIIELIYADDKGYAKSRRRRKSSGRIKPVARAEDVPSEAIVAAEQSVDGSVVEEIEASEPEAGTEKEEKEQGQ
jgi:large subunit ribosomal protein L17